MSYEEEQNEDPSFGYENEELWRKVDSLETVNVVGIESGGPLGTLEEGSDDSYDPAC